MAEDRNYWMMKSEPDVYSYADLESQPDSTDHWDGVRNYQARNMMREMEVGDRVLFYHSNTRPPHVAGIAEVVREAYPDHTAWDPESDYYDPKSSEDEPRWFMVDVKAVEELPATVTLQELKENPKLADMKVVQRGNRLSVMPVAEDEYREILRMVEEKAG